MAPNGKSSATETFPRLGFAQETELERLRAMVHEMQQQLKKALSRIEQLEKEQVADAAKLGQVEKSVKAVQSAPSAFNPAIGLAIDATAEHRAKVGGDFNFRAAELGISAAIDPYARGYAFITGTRDEVEVEEAKKTKIDMTEHAVKTRMPLRMEFNQSS